MNNNIINIFDSEIDDPDNFDLTMWMCEWNNSDCMGRPSINDKGTFRNNFNVNHDEELLFCRDTSFWNERNQGIVITDGGVRVIPDNEKPNEKIVFSWEDVVEVTYKDEVFYFWGSADHDINNCASIHETYFYKSDPDTYDIQSLADLFTKIASAAIAQKDPAVAVIEKMREVSDSNPQKAWEMGIDALGNYPGWDGVIKWNLGSIAYFELKELDKAWKMLLEASESEDTTSYQKSFANYWLSNMLYEKDNNHPAIRTLLFNAAKGDKEAQYDDNTLLYEQAEHEVRILEKEYFGEVLSDRPYAERKLIFPVNNIFDLSTISQEQVQPVELDSLLANTNLQFPLTHPQANQLYVAHPYNPNVYLLYDNYEIEILQDKLRELSEIAQSLGAIEIDVKVISSQGSRSEHKGSMSQSGRVEHWTQTNLGGSQNTSYSRDEEINFEHMFNRHQTFAPKSTISQPQNTVWLQGEPSWQRLIKQRLEGGLTSHREVIETKSSRVISGTASNQLKGEIESIFVDLNLNWNKNEESRYSEHNNLVLSVDIKFSNIQPGVQTLPPPIPSNLTEAELEYKEEYEACLADGVIAASERRLLDRLASKLGLSPEQVKRIEENGANPLTDEEKEYLDEYRACLADDPELSSSTRRLLSKMAKSLGLTEEQVNKLENLK